MKRLREIPLDQFGRDWPRQFGRNFVWAAKLVYGKVARQAGAA
jgi:hypothetical protein